VSETLSEEWRESCAFWRGEVLTGEFAHWCPDWDDLPIDETVPEFDCCCCFPNRGTAEPRAAAPKEFPNENHD
jgi:hypothetical protein